MTSAVDVITYVGVPLAVFGVMPLIWNMTKAFIIRRRLLALIPSNVRKHFTIIMDPAAGCVSVSFEPLSLDSSSLLQYETLGPDDTLEVIENEVTSSWNLNILHEEWEGKRRSKQNWVPSLEFSVSPMLQSPISSWMELAGSCVIPRKSLRSPPPTRYDVDTSLTCSPSLLECQWPTFVCLALGLGASPYHGLKDLADALRAESPLSQRICLRNVKEETVMIVSKTSDGKVVASLSSGSHEFSLQRALAWESISVTSTGKDYQCVSLWDGFKFNLSEIVGFSQVGTAVWYDLSSSGGGDPYIISVLDHIQWEDSDMPRRPWDKEWWHKSLIWTFYTESMYSPKRTLPFGASPRIILMAQHASNTMYSLRKSEKARFTEALDGDEKAARDVLRYLEDSRMMEDWNDSREKWLEKQGLPSEAHPIWKFQRPVEQRYTWKLLTKCKAYQELVKMCQPDSRSQEFPYDLNDLSSPEAFFANLVLACSIFRFLPHSFKDYNRREDGPEKEALSNIMGEKLSWIPDRIFLV